MTTKKSDRGLSREDAQLDAFLAAARPAADAAREAALLDRIMATAERTPRVIARAPAVAAGTVAAVNAPVPPTTPASLVVSLAEARAARRPNRDRWAAGGLLAASLVAGLLLGQMPYAEQTVTRIEQVTGFTLASASNEIARAIAAVELDEDDL